MLLNYSSSIEFSYLKLEMLSEAVKILKAEYCIRAIEKYNMDKALIFCRTKLDCDNLEDYFISMGGGPNSQNHKLSCIYNSFVIFGEKEKFKL
jgi:hypothetical protein